MSVRREELTALGFHLSYYTRVLRRRHTRIYYCFDYAFQFDGPFAHVMRVGVGEFERSVA
ncbi:hypothetical protein [Nitritalea halalkaliphila]|uniref:hypothetical protein n=1 Tax=Nitritalea halalkaliphila TaxID=590849 RepID=UPI0012EA4A01|nr:hypothetical protein [Nitritalea halalkaliphila]